jgi:hypothetical protein
MCWWQLFSQLKRLREFSVGVGVRFGHQRQVRYKTRWPLRDISWCVRVLGADDDASSGFAVNFVRATHPTLEGTAVTRDKSSPQWNPPESWPLAAYVGEGDVSRNIRPVRQALPARARL